MAIDNPQWNAVRAALGADPRELFERVERTSVGADGESVKITEMIPVGAKGQSALDAFKQIEADVERLIQELTSLQLAERELRTALEEPGGAEMQRR